MGTRQGIVGFVYFCNRKYFCLSNEIERKSFAFDWRFVRHLHTNAGADGSGSASGSGGGGGGGSDEEKSDSFPFQEKLFSVKFEKAFWTNEWTDGPTDGRRDPLIEMRGRI